MSRRRVKIILLCEDRRHEYIVRNTLDKLGWNKRWIRVIPFAVGCASQYVIENFPKELKALRSSHVKCCLITIIDEDGKSCNRRMAEFRKSCINNGVDFRQDSEPVMIAIPQRNIETWVYYLLGNEVDEQTDYKKDVKDNDFKTAVANLHQYCSTGNLKGYPPPSLINACDEYNGRINRVKGVLFR